MNNPTGKIIVSVPDQRTGFSFETMEDLREWASDQDEFDKAYALCEITPNHSDIYGALHLGHRFYERWGGKVPLKLLRQLRKLELLGKTYAVSYGSDSNTVDAVQVDVRYVQVVSKKRDVDSIN
jgi:hypothetical protein